MPPERGYKRPDTGKKAAQIIVVLHYIKLASTKLTH